MKQVTINVTISPDGDVTFDVDGVKGKGCLDATKILEKIGKVQSREKKSTYHIGGGEGVSAQV